MNSSSAVAQPQNIAPKHNYKNYLLEGFNFIKFSLLITGLTRSILIETKSIPEDTLKIPTVPIEIRAVCSLISTQKSVEVIIDNFRLKDTKGVDTVEKILVVAQEISSLAIGLMNCFRLSDSMITNLAAIASSMGGVSYVVETMSSLAPFTIVFSVFQIVKESIGIALDTVGIYRTTKKIAAIVEKREIWKELDWTNTDYANKKLAHLKAKQITSNESLVKFKSTSKTAKVALESATLDHQDRLLKVMKIQEEVNDKTSIEQFFAQVIPKIKLTFAQSKMEDLDKKYQLQDETKKKFKAKHHLRELKIANWTNTIDKIQKDNLSDTDKATLDTFKSKEIEKLETKKENVKKERIHIALDAAYKTAVVISMVVSLALTFSGVGTLPGLITAFTFTLFLAAAKYGLKKFKSTRPPETWEKISFPKLI